MGRLERKIKKQMKNDAQEFDKWYADNKNQLYAFSEENNSSEHSKGSGAIVLSKRVLYPVIACLGCLVIGLAVFLSVFLTVGKNNNDMNFIDGSVPGADQIQDADDFDTSNGSSGGEAGDWGSAGVPGDWGSGGAEDSDTSNGDSVVSPDWELGDKLENEEVGTFYTLQEAYDNGFLTREDLQSIANYHNNGEVCADKIDEAKVRLIKESAAKRIREREIDPIVEATAEGFNILGYYGKYTDCYVVEIRDIYDSYPTDVPNYWIKIGGVDFHITSYDTLGCCKWI